MTSNLVSVFTLVVLMILGLIKFISILPKVEDKKEYYIKW